MKQRKVIIPLDGSDFSRVSFRTLGKLFDPETTAVTLVHVGEVPEGAYEQPAQPLIVGDAVSWSAEHKGHAIYTSQAWHSARAEIEAELQDDAERLRAAGFTVYVKALFGDPAQEIADAVEATGCDALIMATHGRCGIGRALLGSVAEKVLRMVLVPVVMVRPREELMDRGPIARLN